MIENQKEESDVHHTLDLEAHATDQRGQVRTKRTEKKLTGGDDKSVLVRTVSQRKGTLITAGIEESEERWKEETVLLHPLLLVVTVIPDIEAVVITTALTVTTALMRVPQVM